MAVPQTYFQDKPLEIGNTTQLLVDDYIVEDRWGLKRVIHPPSKYLKNPILNRDKPWESVMVLQPWVMWDDDFGKYRMWYKCFSKSNNQGGTGPAYYTCYAESDDGFNWEKPLLDVCDFPGHPKSNVVYMSTYGRRTQGTQVLKNPNDEALDRWLLENVASQLHSCGTCKMGPARDPMAVVDQHCKVHGIKGLRVVDASIMPSIIRANTNATVIMAAEKIADDIRDGG